MRIRGLSDRAERELLNGCLIGIALFKTGGKTGAEFYKVTALPTDREIATENLRLLIKSTAEYFHTTPENLLEEIRTQSQVKAPTIAEKFLYEFDKEDT